MDWKQKYRPNRLEDFVCSEKQRNLIESWIRQGECPNLLLVGPYGTGKSSLADLLVNELHAQRLKLNASDERGIEALRGKKRWLRLIAHRKCRIKIFVLDEAEQLTPNFQTALRGTMDEFGKKNRFILTANRMDRIDGGIRDRCTVIEFDYPPREEMAKKAKKILRLEGVSYVIEDVLGIIDESYPSIRKMIDNLQRFSINGKLEIDQQNTT